MEEFLTNIKPGDVTDFLAYVIALTSLLIKWTPTLKDDNKLLPIIKFIGGWIALNKKVKR